MRLLPLPAVILALASSIVHADDRLQVTAVPVPWLVQGEAAGALGYPTPGASASATDSLVYSNTNYSAGYIFSAGAGVQFADDIHLTLPGRLTQFFFFFVEPEPTPIRFTVAFYANDAGDTGIGARLGGPYVLGPFRWGAYRVHATVQHDTVQLDRDAWFGVSIASPSAGLVLADAPFVGASHDLYYDWGLGRTGRFSGAAANFYLQVFVVPETVPVTPSTWSAVKSLFRPVPAASPRRHR